MVDGRNLGPAAGPARAAPVPPRLDRRRARRAARRHRPDRPQRHRPAAPARLPGRRGTRAGRALPARRRREAAAAAARRGRGGRRRGRAARRRPGSPGSRRPAPARWPSSSTCCRTGCSARSTPMREAVSAGPENTGSNVEDPGVDAALLTGPRRGDPRPRGAPVRLPRGRTGSRSSRTGW